MLIITWLWSAFSLIFFFKKRKPIINLRKYNKYVVWIFIGVFISMFSAKVYWNQDFLTTLVAQRGLYNFILLPVLIYIYPTEKDIIWGLKFASYLTIIVWLVVLIIPSISLSHSMDSINLGNKYGYYVEGIHFVVFYYYVITQKIIKNFRWDIFFEILLLMSFIFFYQNRSMLLGAILIFIYALFKFKSRYKLIIFTSLLTLTSFLFILTYDIWVYILNNTINQLNNSEYNRNVSILYYLNEYSPSFFCYIFGNGFPSGGNSTLGNLMWNNFKLGIFASDLGMIGMWADFGIIPIITICSVLIKILTKKKYPLYLKFISIHIILVPTIFHFWNNPGVFLFVLIFYMYAYKTENLKFNEYNVINYHSELQK